MLLVHNACCAAVGQVERSLSAEESTSALAIQQHQLATDHGRLGAGVAAVEARLAKSLRQIQGQLASVHDGHASLNEDGPGRPGAVKRPSRFPM